MSRANTPSPLSNDGLHYTAQELEILTRLSALNVDTFVNHTDPPTAAAGDGVLVKPVCCEEDIAYGNVIAAQGFDCCFFFPEEEWNFVFFRGCGSGTSNSLDRCFVGGGSKLELFLHLLQDD